LGWRFLNIIPFPQREYAVCLSLDEVANVINASAETTSTEDADGNDADGNDANGNDVDANPIVTFPLTPAQVDVIGRALVLVNGKTLAAAQVWKLPRVAVGP
jgi:hypothetical protein